MDAISMVDRPFGCPIDLMIDLPWPPSVNRIWRSQKAGKRRVYLAPEYASWKKAADILAISLGQVKHFKRINGGFEAHIILQRRRGDIDNRVKAILDWAQSRELILDDSNCERLLVERGEAPHGARLILRTAEARL